MGADRDWGETPGEADALTVEANDAADTRTPPEAFFDALQTRSYEVGRAGVIRVGTALRYLESLATRASTDLGFSPTWYDEHGVAWVVREMSLALGDLPTIGDDLKMATWVSDFKRVQAFREYVVTRAGRWMGTGMPADAETNAEGETAHAAPRLVARAHARWAYVDAATGRLTAIHDDLTARMGAFGYAMRPHPWQFAEAAQALQRGGAGQRATPTSELALVARVYEADIHQHINNCVYADWLDEGLHQAFADGQLAALGVASGARARPRYYHIEYVRSLRPGAQVAIRTYALGRRSDVLVVWQEIVADDPDRGDQEPTVALRAYSEHLVTQS